MDESTRDDLFALNVALYASTDKHYIINHICVSSLGLTIALYSSALVTTWPFNSQIDEIRSLLERHDSPSIHCIPVSWMQPAVSLATHEFNHSLLNLFLFGRELLHWIMKTFIDVGFVF